MFIVYVLRSQTSGRQYIGFTADPVQRLGQHNAGITKSTKHRGPRGWCTRNGSKRAPRPCAANATGNQDGAARS
jgi:predicted GIY-YIG superfamily endonuclease